MLSIFRCLSVAILGVFFAAGPAAAQIYSWRDAKGNLVLSDQRPGGTTHYETYATPGRDAPFRTTRAPEAPFKGQYDNIISRHAATYGVSRDLVRAVVQVESGFNPYARSSRGAMGLMQLMPATAVEMGVRNPFDPEQNIRGGVAYLAQLLNRYAGDVTLALAAYNAGPTAVDRYGNQVPPYSETRQYVSKVKNGGGAANGVQPGKPDPRAAGSAKPAPAPPPPRYVYKTVEMIEGHAVTKYSDTRPASGPYEVVPRR